MKLSKRKVYFLTFAVGGILLFVFIRLGTYLSGPPEASLLKAVSSTSTPPIYSFYKDDDLDGLSNAKEVIYGTDPRNPDTDQDGYDDGREVAYGYDPLKPGEAQIKDRKDLNLTLRYFVWAQNKGIKDVQIRQDLLNSFFQEHSDLVAIQLVDKKEIHLSSQNSAAALKKYLEGVGKISLPEGMVSYQKIVRGYSAGSEPLLKDLLAKIELAYLDFKGLSVPPLAQDLQVKYLTVVHTFYQMFNDLTSYQKNPVQIELDLRKEKKLLDLSQMVEKDKQALIEKYHLK